MPRYQVKLLVDIDAADADEAWAIAEGLEDFLGLHCDTATSGLAQEVLEVTPEEEIQGIEDDAIGESSEDLDDTYDPMLDVNYVGHPCHY